MKRGSPQPWSLAVAGDEDDSLAVRRPSTANAPPSEMEYYFSEFFGPLSPVGGGQLLSHSVAAAAVAGHGAESSGDVEKESSSGTKSGPVGGAADVTGCPSEEVDGRSQLPRKRKRNRTSEMHNLTERRRRDRIKEKLKTLQGLIPNAHKLDRASLLDEAIGYIKSLQQQLQVMSVGSPCPAPFLPPPALHYPHMPRFSLFPAAGLNLGMNIGFGMGVPGMACSTGNPLMSPSSSLRPTSLHPMAAVSPISHFQSPMAMDYRLYNTSQEFPMPAATTAICSQALQAELLHSANRAESSCPEVKGTMHDRLQVPRSNFSGSCSTSS